jgi:parallel beta-helix repeat protein
MTALSIQPPFPIFTDTDGSPLENGYVWLGTANQDPQANPIAAYWDAALTIPAAQPIRTSGGYPARSGTPARLYVASDYSIRVQNKNGSQIYSAPDGATDRFSAAQITYFPAGLGAVPTTVQAKLRETVSVKDFGATGAGYPTDDRAAIQAAFDAHQCVYFPEGEYYIGGAIIPQGNSLIYGSGRESHIVIKDGDTTGIDLTSKTGVTVRDLKLSCRGSVGTLGGLSGKAAIYLNGSSQCTVEGNFIFNCYNAGIRLYASSNNTIRGNYFGDWYTTGTSNDDSANISCLGANSYNVVDGNYCLGANAGSGIVFNDYYVVGAEMVGNIISNNVVAGKKAYGILFYTTTTAVPLGYDCKSVITNNVVSDIDGSYVGGASGAGIYLQGAGGAVCSDNTVYNCCKSTSNFGTLAMACITASIADEVQTASIIVSNNQVHSLRGPGIWAASSQQHGIHVQGNVVRAEELTGSFNSGIRMTKCSYSNIIGNKVYQMGSNAGVFVDCIDASQRAINVSGNHVHATNASGVAMVFSRTTSGVMEDVVISGNTINSVYDGLQVSYVDYGSITDNKVFVGNIAFFWANSQYTNVSANSFRSTLSSGSNYDVILAEGTGCVFDKLNIFSEKIQHTGTGIVEQYTPSGSSLPPIYGTYAVGDRVINRAAVVGQPKAWRCTTAGEPGTWTSEGNL